MTHLSVREWGRVPVGEGGFSRREADALLAAARAHPKAHEDATNILVDLHKKLAVRQMVGVIAAEGCSLEILPKVDPADGGDEDAATVRSRLMRMLQVALGLDLSLGSASDLARQGDTLLDVIIRVFADQLLAEVRRGLPRRYLAQQNDLAAMRGSLDVTRQFTVHAVRPDRLACRYDELDANTPLMQIMATSVAFLGNHARSIETQRRLSELRHAFAEIRTCPVSQLPWQDVRIDRTNRRWRGLLDLAALLLRRDWQATHHDPGKAGITLLFPMNDLFEAYVGAMLRRAFAGTGISVTEQGGRAFCLGHHTGEHLSSGHLFQTKPDFILKRGGDIVAIIDTKWKRLAEPTDGKRGISQSDIYQLMAYARLYQARELMLLYPAVPGEEAGLQRGFGIVQGHERLSIATVDLSLGEAALLAQLRATITPTMSTIKACA
ncbi:McrC family protein [Sphingomicrobium nitratireducens]|uniref:McrC family protein n=1 Tax=Sphingomicrobium nitratireducens TaxID=2964666 RepID=UPI0022402A53|nr:restriction endonuclease [Sphingomicrobium nitratireducens]